MPYVNSYHMAEDWNFSMEDSERARKRENRGVGGGKRNRHRESKYADKVAQNRRKHCF